MPPIYANSNAAAAHRAPPPPYSPAANVTLPRVAALPRPIDGYTGPMPQVAPKPELTQLEGRINGILAGLNAATSSALSARTGWADPLDRVKVEMVDRAGMRMMLREHEGYSTIMAFLLSWVMPITYAPGLGRVLVVAPTAKRYDEQTLRFQLANAMVLGALGREHRSFFDHIGRRMVSVRQRSHDIYACRAWAHALGDSVGIAVAPKGRKGPWWQRLALLCLWPFAKLTVGPQRLARQFVPILEKVVRGNKGLVDRMFRFPPLCSVLYGKPGRRLLVVEHTPDYKRAQLTADVAVLRQYNPQAGATSFSAEI